jgi:ribonucleoside-triphosphate reductase
MNHLRNKTEQWKKETGYAFGLYGSPIESTTYKFARCLKKRFGIIEGITDKDYITNSYHVNVCEHINAFDKMDFESQFQKISSGGSVSYVEVPNMNKNLDAIKTLVDYMYEHIQYCEINTKSDYCMVCGFDGEILIDDELEWYCPNCGNKDQDKMSVIRRTCGLT